MRGTTSYRVNAAELSFVAFHATADLFDTDTPFHYAFLGTRTGYEQGFGRAAVGADDLRMPWNHHRGDTFWRHYLGPAYDRTTGFQAWDSLVPLRRYLPSPAETETRYDLEAFFFPFGVALVVTLHHRTPAELDAFVDTCRAHRAFAERVLEAGSRTARAAAFGDRDVDLAPVAGPFSLVTVIRGGSPDGRPIAPGDPDPDVLCALEGLVTWREDWRDVTPEVLSGRPLRLRPTGLPHVHYASSRGRAVWFPKAFARPSTLKGSLACYHRNQLMVAVFGEAFCGLGLVTRELDARNAVLPSHRSCAYNAAFQVKRLFSGSVASYQSPSFRDQLETHLQRDEIDDLVIRFGRRGGRDASLFA